MDIDDVMVGPVDGPGRKDDGEKLMYQLLPPDAIRSWFSSTRSEQTVTARTTT